MKTRTPLPTLFVSLICAAAALAGTDDWAHQVKLPEGEVAQSLFNGADLSGWEGTDKYWSVVDGAIEGKNTTPVPASTYLFTKKSYRSFRLLLEVKQTMGSGYSTIHSAVAALGQVITDAGDPHGFKGPLLMFCHDWGIWDAHRRNRVEPAKHAGSWHPPGIEKEGNWNQIEILVIGDRIRMAANGKLVFDFTDQPDMLKESPLGLQLHQNNAHVTYHFRGLVLTENPKDQLVTAP
ncbi:MAG: DUF1080 domain-containing protein [Planctomycetes bacterium]|nr:DUF1080 domain-containing protein [Planctomycetota bacterium]